MCSAASFALAAAATLTLAFSVSAQDKGKSTVLQPQMNPEGGFGKVMGKLGTKSAQPWSATTLGASIDGKPNPGTVRTVVGEILDFSCYLEIGKHGDKHRDCAQKCFRNGQPIGLLTENGTLYMLMEEEHDPRRDGLGIFRQAAVDHAAHVMEVTGTVFSHNGYNAMYVRGFLKK
jgi:hypothetical protein